jgi:hypothetical protein
MLNLVRFWILLSALLVGAGWVLSALHQLNRTGYLLVFVLAGMALLGWRRKFQRLQKGHFSRSARKSCRRLRRPAPCFFFILVAMSFLSGAIYLASNPDTAAYRVPRVLHWLGEEHWHYIHTTDQRMNAAGTGWEWLSAPLILFTRGEKILFLINAVSYLMLPGLIFSVFRRLGVPGRVAWWWMWLAASGWCYALQAGSVVNDAFAAVYALASVDLALRALEKKSLPDLWLSLLAAALVTGVKQTNLPLALLWFIAAWPARRWLLVRPLAALGAGLAALMISALPVTISNFIHAGNWTGLAIGGGKDFWNPSPDSPFWGIVGNTFCLPAQNLMPPFFPWTESWNAAMKHFVATPFGSHFSSFETFGQLSFGMHGIGETNAGLGLGLCLLTVCSLAAAGRLRKTCPAGKFSGDNLQLKLLRIVPWGLLLLFMAKVGTYENARQLSPYYVFFFPLLLVQPGQAQLVRRRWWRRLSVALMLFTALLVMGSRARPLFPAQILMGWLQKEYPGSKLVARAAFSFDCRTSVVDQRREWLAKNIPAAEKTIGYATVIGSAESILWLPFSQRHVERITPADTPETLAALEIHYALVDSSALETQAMTLEQWLEKYRGGLVAQFGYLLQPSMPLQYLYLVRLREDINPNLQ